ncbi:MAG TPA: EpsD family peptidyl-prolyl cis-trans isomerase [Lysobacter sp.]|jgi:EpsD family peptidyl-prolyl cis-trans isomerase|nr:EpsD family peptidyl-prolyl cis-trans isomerase [Lysobacter sp.]
MQSNYNKYKLLVLRLATVGTVALAALLAGCGDKKGKVASQTAAKVNKEEITVHQINFVLQQQRNLRPENTEAASRQALERLIDQELAVQKAGDMKLDRDPRVVQAMEAAKREIIARAYFDKVSEAAAKPTAEDIKKYYADKPALFSERRIYNLQEIVIEAKPEQVEGLRVKLGATKSINEFVDYLKANEFRFAGNQAVRAAEQLPLASLDGFAKLKDGQSVFQATPTGAQVIVLAGSRSQPIDLERAKPSIEQFLLNERKRQLIDQDVKDMRSLARIEYVGKFAQAASAPRADAPASGAPAAAPASASAALDADAISKGLGGK